MFVEFFVLLAAVAICQTSHADVIRPCHLKDLKCIRDNLAANSKCNPKVKGNLPPEYVLKMFKFDTPYFNATYIDHDLIIRNHDQCVVSEFFFNMKADTAVLALDCPLLDLESDRTLLQHYSLKEDVVYNYHIRGKYPLIRLTINLRNANAVDLCSSFTFADVTALPAFHVDPKDKPTANFLSRDLTMLNIYERETFYYRAPQLSRYFINSLICDFGCNL